MGCECLNIYVLSTPFDSSLQCELPCTYVIPDKGPGDYQLGTLLWNTPCHSMNRRELLKTITSFLGDEDFGGKSKISLKLKQDDKHLANFQLSSNRAIINSYDGVATVHLKPGIPVCLEFISDAYYQTAIPPKQ